MIARWCAFWLWVDDRADTWSRGGKSPAACVRRDRLYRWLNLLVCYITPKDY